MLADFFNKAKERIFNDNLICSMALEIKLKSGNINEYLILPTYFDHNFFYNGVRIPYYISIQKMLSKEYLKELQSIIKEGSSMDFKNYNEIKKFLQKKMIGINDCCLCAINALVINNF